MKAIIAYPWLFFCAFSCFPANGQSDPHINAEWLMGTWKRTDAPAGKSAFESWWKTTSGQWAGLGVTLQGQDTVFAEKLKLEMQAGKPYYMAEVSHNQEPTYFAVTFFAKNRLVGENPQHDFPKKIEYERKKNELIAVISGDGKAKQFRFVRLSDP